MSLYGYVANREALLDAVVDGVIDELWADPEVQFQSEDGWRDYLSCLAHGVRRFALRTPGRSGWWRPARPNPVRAATAALAASPVCL